jgi:hypothetical protein
MVRLLKVTVFASILSVSSTVNADAESGILDGALRTEATMLASTSVPVLLPESVPSEYRIALVRVTPNKDRYLVLYSNGTSAFAVSGAAGIVPNDDDTPDSRRYLTLLGTRIHSGTFGDVAIQSRTRWKNGCMTTRPVALVKRPPPAATYAVESCRSLTADQLASVVASMRQVTSFNVSGSRARDSAATIFSTSQRSRLRSVFAPLVVFGYVPAAFQVLDFNAEPGTGHGPGAFGAYRFRIGHGGAYIDVGVTTGGWGGADVPMQDLSVPVHSRLLGETRLVHEQGMNAGCFGPENPLLMLPLDVAAFSFTACGVSPYAVKRAVESARIVRP